MPTERHGLEAIGWRLPALDLTACTACGYCVAICPNEVFALVDGLPRLAAPDRCGFCGLCEELCPSGAVRCEFEVSLAPPGERRKTLPALVEPADDDDEGFIVVLASAVAEEQPDTSASGPTSRPGGQSSAKGRGTRSPRHEGRVGQG